MEGVGRERHHKAKVQEINVTRLGPENQHSSKVPFKLCITSTHMFRSATCTVQGATDLDNILLEDVRFCLFYFLAIHLLLFLILYYRTGDLRQFMTMMPVEDVPCSHLVYKTASGVQMSSELTKQIVKPQNRQPRCILTKCNCRPCDRTSSVLHTSKACRACIAAAMLFSILSSKAQRMMKIRPPSSKEGMMGADRDS